MSFSFGTATVVSTNNDNVQQYRTTGEEEGEEESGNDGVDPAKVKPPRGGK